MWTRAVPVAAALLDYVQALVAHTRRELALGLSPRAAQGLLRAGSVALNAPGTEH